jgi:peptidoglycan biosynthesis protein MviN/MurJ (putative lipid II flippase)
MGSMQGGMTADDKTSHRLILKGMVWVTAFVLLAKLAGAAKEVALAASFGVGPVVDAYALVFNTVMWPVALCMSALTTVLVPLEARLGAEAPEQRARFRRELLGATLVLAALVGALMWAVLPWLLARSAGPVVRELASEMSPVLVLSAALALVTTLFSVWIMAGGRYANTVLEGVPALVLMAVLLLAPAAQTRWLVLGTLGGIGVHLLLLVLLQPRMAEGRWPTLRWSSPAWRSLGSGLGLTFFGQALISSTVVIESYLAAQLASGSVATLGYANRLLALFTGLVALAVTRSMLPVLSATAVADPQAGLRLVSVWLRRLFLVGLAMAAALWLAAEPLTRLLFERGQFGAQDTVRVAGTLRWAAFQLPILLPGMVLTSYAAATGCFGVLFASAVLSFLARPLTGWLLGPLMGVPGLALAQVLAYALSVLCLLLWLVRLRKPAASSA